jgi:hypothetical protein
VNDRTAIRVRQLIFWTKQHDGPTYEQAADIALEEGILDEFIEACKMDNMTKKEGGK